MARTAFHGFDLSETAASEVQEVTKALPSTPRLTRRRCLMGSGLGLVAAGGLIEGIFLEPNRLSISSHVEPGGSLRAAASL